MFESNLISKLIYSFKLSTLRKMFVSCESPELNLKENSLQLSRNAHNILLSISVHELNNINAL